MGQWSSIKMYTSFDMALILCSDVDIIQCDSDVAQNLPAITFNGTYTTFGMANCMHRLVWPW
jgi:hypothetical protein